MWTRKGLKNKAKEVLKTNYWKAFVVSLVILFAGASNNKFSLSIEKKPSNLTFDEEIMTIVVIIFIIIAFRFFIGYVLEVGGRKFFIKAAAGKESKLGYLIDYFGDDGYLNLIVAMLLRTTYIILWTLLLIIPGIVKAYAYRMVPYLLADNPNLGAKRAIELSDQMTDGHKGDIFILDLSFLGWYLLAGMLALVIEELFGLSYENFTIGTSVILTFEYQNLSIGSVFVMPYENATNAELYLELRKNAIRRGLTSNEELNIETS